MTNDAHKSHFKKYIHWPSLGGTCYLFRLSFGIHVAPLCNYLIRFYVTLILVFLSGLYTLILVLPSGLYSDFGTSIWIVLWFWYFYLDYILTLVLLSGLQFFYKRKRKAKGQTKMDNPETLAILGTQDTKHNTEN